MKSENPVDLAIATLAEMHAENEKAVPHAQLGIERVTALLGRPWFAWAAVLFVASWVALNLAYQVVYHQSIDRPQFPLLSLIVSLASLFVTILILITQNRQNTTAYRRAEVTLQMSVVTEQKVAKIIDLLEQLRRDDPHVPNRRDPQAESMAQATDLRDAASQLHAAQAEASRAARAMPSENEDAPG